MHAQHREETAGHAFCVDEFRFESVALNVPPRTAFCGDAGEDVIVLAVVVIALPRKVIARRIAGVVDQKLHQLSRIAHWQQSKEQRVHQAEDGGIGADSQREGKHRREGEAGGAPHGAQGVSDILPHAATVLVN